MIKKILIKFRFTKSKKTVVYFDSYTNMISCMKELKSYVYRYSSIYVYDFWKIVHFYSSGIFDESEQISTILCSANWALIPKWYTKKDILRINIKRRSDGWYFKMSLPI